MDHLSMAGTAQKMLMILNMQCPANYECGGSAYAGVAAVDNILHLMGIGIGMLRPARDNPHVQAFEKHVRESAVAGDSIVGKMVDHKSQIVAGALHSILVELRTKTFREPPEAVEKAVLSLLQWYLAKSGLTKEALLAKVDQPEYDCLQQMEAMQ